MKGLSKNVYVLKKSPRSDKKFLIITPEGKKINFGAAGYSDYTKHKNPERKQRYIIRHQKRENWTKSGINSAGFWSRYLLWGEPTLEKSIKYIETKFNITIVRR